MAIQTEDGDIDMTWEAQSIYRPTAGGGVNLRDRESCEKEREMVRAPLCTLSK
jgi:hypothetical protein